jgi:ABC-type transport system involved in cytochrome c biogenesis permease component
LLVCSERLSLLLLPMLGLPVDLPTLSAAASRVSGLPSGPVLREPSRYVRWSAPGDCPYLLPQSPGLP